jgi:hypothetical protein
MAEPHDFDNTVVAILDEEPLVREATEGLSDAGYDFEVLVDEEGREHIDPSSEEGLMATLNQLITAFGDQHRIIDRLDDALERGRIVISVDVEDEDPSGAISILRDHGGHYVWKLGEWTFTPIEE